MSGVSVKLSFVNLDITSLVKFPLSKFKKNIWLAFPPRSSYLHLDRNKKNLHVFYFLSRIFLFLFSSKLFKLFM